MKILRHHWHEVQRPDCWTLYPIGDIHLGNAACDERMFRAAVQRIAADDRALWIGMGDYCDFINMSDPRFCSESLAPWVKMAHLGDLARAQSERFLDIVQPIAGKCLGLVEGNHERSIQKYYERSIYSEIVSGIKERGGFDADHQLAFGYSGWLMLHFYRSEKRTRGSLIRIYLHHGFVGGKLAGAKALNMQRILWNHECDLAVMGHSHNSAVQIEAVERVKGNRIEQEHRIGMFGGTFMSGAGYAEVKGYFPLPLTQPHVLLRPGAKEHRDRIKVVS